MERFWNAHAAVSFPQYAEISHEKAGAPA